MLTNAALKNATIIAVDSTATAYTMWQTNASIDSFAGNIAYANNAVANSTLQPAKIFLINNA